MTGMYQEQIVKIYYWNDEYQLSTTMSCDMSSVAWFPEFYNLQWYTAYHTSIFCPSYEDIIHVPARRPHERGTYYLIDVQITDIDTASYINKKPYKVLESSEKLKKKYLHKCLDQRHHFTPLTASADIRMIKEAYTFGNCKK